MTNTVLGTGNTTVTKKKNLYFLEIYILVGDVENKQDKLIGYVVYIVRYIVLKGQIRQERGL